MKWRWSTVLAAALAAPVAIAAAVQEPSGRASPLALALQAPTSATLGEDIQLDVTLTNNGQKAAEIAPLVFDERSLSFEVEWSGKTFTYSILNGDPHIAQRLALQRVRLGSGASHSTAVLLPTVGTGTFSIRAVYSGAAEPIRSQAAKVAVQPAQGPSGEQARLAAKVTLAYDGSDKSFWIDLQPEAAPNGVCQFVSLARRGFYDGLKVFSVVRRNWIRAGCPYNEGFGTPGYTFRSEAEAQPTLEPPRLHATGTVSLSQAAKIGHAGSQFFICLRDGMGFLDGKFTIIGQVALDQGEPEPASKILKDAERRAEPELDSDRPANEILVKSISIHAR